MDISHSDALAKDWAKKVARPYEKISAFVVENGFSLKVQYQAIWNHEYFDAYVMVNRTMLKILNAEDVRETLDKFLEHARTQARVPLEE